MIIRNPENGVKERFEVRIFLKANKAWRFRRWLGKHIIDKATWIGSVLCGIQFTFIEKNDVKNREGKYGDIEKCPCWICTSKRTVKENEDLGIFRKSITEKPNGAG